MTEQLRAMQQQIVAAVQQQLTQYSQQVAAEVQRLRDEITAERTARSQTEDQLRALAAGLEQSHQANGRFQAEFQRAVEERLTEFGTATKRRHEEMAQRLDRVVDEANVGLAAAVESATRPILRQVEHRQDKVEADVVLLDKSLRKFDEQAAKMVSHINAVTTTVEARLEHVSNTVVADVEGRVAGLGTRLDELSAQAARHQSEVSNIVGQRVDEAETRISDRIVTATARLEEEVGARIADIDAYVGRVSVGLDEGIVMLNDRISQVHAKFDESGRMIAEMERKLTEVDVDAIDEMKEKVSSAAGEAMLVRIEMERFQSSMGEAMDKTTVRLTELETQMQDQAMDTETAVQLERLEEVERALIALDPSQFVRVDGTHRPTSAPSMSAASYGTDSAMTPPAAASPTHDHPTNSMAAPISANGQH